MNIEELYTMHFMEEKRLNQDNASSIEYLTNKKYILSYLKPNDKILELGAATGLYTTMLAECGYDVTAVELVQSNLDKLKTNTKAFPNVKSLLGNAIDLSLFEDESFDVVLNMGPLYHHPDINDQIKIVLETKRVLRKGGFAFFAFISNDMVFVTEALKYNPKFLEDESSYNLTTHKLNDIPFTVLTIEQIESLMSKNGFIKDKFIASDTYAELLADEINKLNPSQFKRWLNYHFYICEKRESLNASHHLLYIAKK